MTAEESIEVNNLAVSEQDTVDNNENETAADSNQNDAEAPLESSAAINNDNNTKNINIDELMGQLEDSIAAETKRYKSVIVVLWIIAVIFLVIWVVGLPLAVAFSEDWTYAAAWYFSIQAGFGVGYGALNVNTKGMEIFLIVHLFLGAISISFLVAYLIRYVREQ